MFEIVTSNPFHESCGCGMYTSVGMSWRGTPFHSALLSIVHQTHMRGVNPLVIPKQICKCVPLEFGHSSNLVFLISTGTHMLQRTHPSWLWHIWRTTEQPHHCHLWNRQPISASVVWLYMNHWTVLHLFVMWIPSISPKRNQSRVG